jgi:hypothetical protein
MYANLKNANQCICQEGNFKMYIVEVRGDANNMWHYRGSTNCQSDFAFLNTAFIKPLEVLFHGQIGLRITIVILNETCIRYNVRSENRSFF